MESLNIIGYIHVCQKEGWKRSFDLIFSKIKESHLYEHTAQIRLSILSDNEFIDDERFNDPKMTIVYKGRSEEYERPTLLHMKKQSFIDPLTTRYYYLHTKGLRHFNTEREGPVLDWIKLMLYWNIERWDNAIHILNYNYWTYGCNFTGIHYSGNFWWSKPSHIQRLSDDIPDYYTSNEDWVSMLYYGQHIIPVHPEFYSVFNSGLEGEGHYHHLYPESNYRLISK